MPICFLGHGPGALHRWRVGSPRRDRPGLEQVAWAVCLPLQQPQPGFKSFGGGLYRDDRSYLEASGMKTHGKVFLGPRVADWPADLPVLRGRSFYLGLCHDHYGHFLTETIASRLWPLSPEELAGYDHFILFPRQHELPAYARDLFEMIGVRDRVRIIDRPTRIEQVAVPSPALQYPGKVHQSIENIHRLIPVADAPVDERPLFLSRGALPAGYSRVVIGEATIEEELERQGALIFCPEQHTLAEQIATFRRHRTLIGFAGSALHTLILTAGHKQVIGYSARRVPHIFPLLDQVLGNHAHYVRAHEARHARLARLKTGFQPDIIDDRAVLEVLQTLGLVGPLPRKTRHDWDHVAAQYNTALLLRYIVEQSPHRDDDHLHGFIAGFRQRHPLDRTMIADSCRSHALFGRFF